MKVASLPRNEKERLEALLRYDILDTEFEVAYDELTELAASICGTPIALISLIDPHRQWFKSKVGLDARETPRDIAFCSHTILQEKIFVVQDTLNDERFADNPLVVGNPHIRFYAGAPLVTPDGFALGTLCIIDHVPRVLSDAQLKALTTLAKQVISQLELRLSFCQLQEHAQQLRELNASKDKFFSVIAHDLRAPFNGLLAFTEILQSELDALSKAEIREIIVDLRTSARETFKLVENLLQWSMLETGNLHWQPEKIQLNALITRITAMLSGIAAQKRIRVVVEPSTDVPVYADANMIGSVIQNLISNAIKFTPANGNIRIVSGVIDKFIEVSVIDDGTGMNQEQLQKLFRIETCFSTKGTTGETGTGLGLLLCKKFIEKNGGTLGVVSEIGKSTKFTFTLPKAE